MTKYKIIQIGVLPGCISSYATDINNKGQVVGYSSRQDGNSRAFLYNGDDGMMTDLGTLPGKSFSQALGVNDEGKIVGVSGNSAFIYDNGKMVLLGEGLSPRRINETGHIVGTLLAVNRAFLYKNGQVIDLGVLPLDKWSNATDINNHDQITGASSRPSSPTNIDEAFKYDKNITSRVGSLPGASYSYAWGINDHGHIVGVSGGHAFFYDGGAMTGLGLLPNARSAFAMDINNGGQIVGMTGDNRIFLYISGQTIDLRDILINHEGWEFVDVCSINDSGVIVGTGNFYGFPKGFMMIPL